MNELQINSGFKEISTTINLKELLGDIMKMECRVEYIFTQLRESVMNENYFGVINNFDNLKNIFNYYQNKYPEFISNKNYRIME